MFARLLLSLVTAGFASLALPPASVAAPAPLPITRLSALEGSWQLAAVLAQQEADRSSLPAVDWARAGATFRALGDGKDELHAVFTDAPLSQPGGTAGGAFTYKDAHSGTLQLSSELPAPSMRELERLDGTLLPNAFVLAERANGAHFVYVRSDALDAAGVEAAIAQAAEQAGLAAVATRDEK